MIAEDIIREAIVTVVGVAAPSPSTSPGAGVTVLDDYNRRIGNVIWVIPAAPPETEEPPPDEGDPPPEEPAPAPPPAPKSSGSGSSN